MLQAIIDNLIALRENANYSNQDKHASRINQLLKKLEPLLVQDMPEYQQDLLAMHELHNFFKPKRQMRPSTRAQLNWLRAQLLPAIIGTAQQFVDRKEHGNLSRPNFTNPDFFQLLADIQEMLTERAERTVTLLENVPQRRLWLPTFDEETASIKRTPSKHDKQYRKDAERGGYYLHTAPASPKTDLKYNPDQLNDLPIDDALKNLIRKHAAQTDNGATTIIHYYYLLADKLQEYFNITIITDRTFSIAIINEYTAQITLSINSAHYTITDADGELHHKIAPPNDYLFSAAIVLELTSPDNGNTYQAALIDFVYWAYDQDLKDWVGGINAYYASESSSATSSSQSDSETDTANTAALIAGVRATETNHPLRAVARKLFDDAPDNNNQDNQKEDFTEELAM